MKYIFLKNIKGWFVLLGTFYFVWIGLASEEKGSVMHKSLNPVEKNGMLQVHGNQIVNAKGETVSFAGPSLFWSNIQWSGANFFNKKIVEYVVNEWEAEIIRVPIGASNKGGYLSHPKENLLLAEQVIEAAIEFGM